jgi:type IV pilus assembly protein PilB
MAKFDKKLAAILNKCGVINEEQRDNALAESEKNNTSLTQVLLDRKFCDEERLITAVADEMAYYPINLAKVEPTREALELLSEEQAKSYQVLPLSKMGKMVTLAIANPFDVLILDDVKIVTGCEIIPVLSTETTIKRVTELAYKKPVDMQGELAATAAQLENDYNQPSEAGSEAPLPAGAEEEDENSAPIVKLSNRIIEDAYLQGASDIHIEPGEEAVYVRYRIDGVLKEQMQLPKASQRALVSRLKIMSELNISEHRLPQDGRIVYKKYNSKFDLDLRVSSAPLNHGEKICLRILDKTKSCLPLDKLGFSDYNLKLYRDVINVPWGMVLHTGPTGSGKSMTLYAALNELSSTEWNISTAEDPIEYTLPRLNQMQVRKDIGLTFATALRCYLRQDPDILLVGEIRDRETADIAVEAALTGHVLFSTLHTNDASSSLQRLTELGIEPFMISTCLVCVCSQRLLRRLCTCASPENPKPEETALLCRAKDGTPIGKILRPAGCPKCANSGYKGRSGVHELLRNCEELSTLINRNANAHDLKEAARRNGMRTLFEDCMEKVKAGITAMPEAIATARPD